MTDSRASRLRFSRIRTPKRRARAAIEESVEAVAGELGAGDGLVGELELGLDGQAEPGGVVAALALLVGDALGLLQVGGVAAVGRGGRGAGTCGLDIGIFSVVSGGS